MNARAIYLAIKDDKSCIAELRARRKTLALDATDPDKMMDVTSFTLNGQSASGDVPMTKGDLLRLISDVLWMVDNNASLSTRRTGVIW